MKKIVLIFFAIFFFGATSIYAAAIQYIGNGKGEPKVKITWSRNNGTSWETKMLVPGQTFQIPRDATHLKIDNVPHNPNRNYKIKDGHVS